MAGEDLSHHGDAEAAPGLVDLAVNVRREPPPGWLSGAIAATLTELARYPDPAPARAAVAARHNRPVDEVLLTAGAAEGFVLLARALCSRSPGSMAPGSEVSGSGVSGVGMSDSGALGSMASGPGVLGEVRRAVVVHPQFTEPEAALRHAGHAVDRVLLAPERGFRLDPDAVPGDADLVIVGNPTNPTSVLHPAAAVAALARPGRILVVDEAFADSTYAPGVAGEPESLAERRDLPGLVVVRSLTKTWGLAGLRIGYLLGAADVLARLAAAQPLWAVSTPALAAAQACASPRAVAAEREIAARLAAERAYLVARLRALPGVAVPGDPASAFVPLRCAGADRIRLALRDRGYAVRRGDTFPGLGADWLRVAVRDTATTDAFVTVLADLLDREQHGGD